MSMRSRATTWASIQWKIRLGIFSFYSFFIFTDQQSLGVGTYEHALKGDDLGFRSVKDKVRNFFFLFPFIFLYSLTSSP